MNYFLKFFVFAFFISLCVFDSEGKWKHRPGRSKNGKNGKLPRSSLQTISTCMGQPVDLRAQVENATQECLDTRIQEIQEHVEANGNGNGKAAKKEKKKEKLAKKLRRRCLPECEWRVFELIPAVDENDNVTYPSIDIPDTFLKIFPQGAQDTLKAEMEACYNTTSAMVVKEGKRGLKEKMCFTNFRLIKCLIRSVRQTCKDKTGAVQPYSGTGSTAAPKSGLSRVSTTPPSGHIADDDNDDDVDDDKDDEDIEEDENTLAKTTPSTKVDTSQPITK